MKYALPFLVASTAAFAQTPAPQPPANVTLPLDLVQALVNAGQNAPGKEINPLTDRVRQLVNEQMAKQQAMTAPVPKEPAPPMPDQPGPGAPVKTPPPPAASP